MADLHLHSHRSSKSYSHYVLGAVLLLLAIMLALDNPQLVHWLRAYPARFLRYYGPKWAFLTCATHDMVRHLPELPEEIQDAWDFSVLVLVVTTMYQLIERARVWGLAVLRR